MAEFEADERRPILIGEAPSRSGDKYWRFPLSGDPAVKLCRWAGWPVPKGEHAWWTLVEHLRPHNLLERYPGAQGSGAAFPRELAEPAWQALLPELKGRVVVLLGTRLGKLAGVPVFYDWCPHPGGFDVVVVPHTSGLSHTYNDRDKRQRTGEVLREACRRAADRG